MHVRLFALICVAFVSSLPAFAADDKKDDKKTDQTQIRQKGVGGGINFYSLPREISLGRELARDIQLYEDLLDDPVIGEYVNRIAQNLCRNSDSKFLLTVRVLRSDDINALALPGGFMFINAGTIMAARNEAELAGVIAHEIGHVAARHATRRATQQQLIDLGSLGIMLIGGLPGYVVRETLNAGSTLAFKKLSRRAENEADRLGVQYLYKTGYDPGPFINFLERLDEGESIPLRPMAGIFGTHPQPKSRARSARKHVQRSLPSRPELVVQTPEFDAVKTRLAAILKGIRVPDPATETERRLSAKEALEEKADSDRPPVLRRRN